MAHRLTERPVMTREQFMYGCRCRVASIAANFVASFACAVWLIQYCLVIPIYRLLRLFPGTSRQAMWRPWRVWPSKQWWQRLDRHTDGDGGR